MPFVWSAVRVPHAGRADPVMPVLRKHRPGETAVGVRCQHRHVVRNPVRRSRVGRVRDVRRSEGTGGMFGELTREGIRDQGSGTRSETDSARVCWAAKTASSTRVALKIRAISPDHLGIAGAMATPLCRQSPPSEISSPGIAQSTWSCCSIRSQTAFHGTNCMAWSASCAAQRYRFLPTSPRGTADSPRPPI